MTPKELAIRLATETKYKFRLSGSRFFAARNTSIEVTDETDWDFYVQYEDGVEEFLAQLGFVCLNKRTHQDAVDARYPMDDLALSYWCREDEKVEVIIRSDAELYRKVLNSMTDEFFTRFIWKSSPFFEFKSKSRYTESTIIRSIMNQLFRTASK